METTEGIKAPEELETFIDGARPLIGQMALLINNNRRNQPGSYIYARTLLYLHIVTCDLRDRAVKAIETLGDSNQILQALHALYKKIFQDDAAANIAFSDIRDKILEIHAERIKNPPYLRETFEGDLRDKFIQYSVALDYPEKRRRLSGDELRRYLEYTDDDRKRIFQEIIQLVARAVRSEGFDAIMPLVIAMLNDLAKTDVIKPVQAENPDLEVFAMGICHNAALFNESQ